MSDTISGDINLRFVITGGPGFGKSTLINELEQRGLACRHEISRSIIKEQLAMGGDVLPWKNLSSFSRLVIEKRLLQYNETLPGEITFFDRGIPDVLAYMEHDKLHMPEYMMDAANTAQYNRMVFVTPPWKDIFKPDKERMEDFEKACSLHEALENTYARLGYCLIEIPLCSVEERASFVLKSIVKQEA